MTDEQFSELHRLAQAMTEKVNREKPSSYQIKMMVDNYNRIKEQYENSNGTQSKP